MGALTVSSVRGNFTISQTLRMWRFRGWCSDSCQWTPKKIVFLSSLPVKRVNAFSSFAPVCRLHKLTTMWELWNFRRRWFFKFSFSSGLPVVGSMLGSQRLRNLNYVVIISIHLDSELYPLFGVRKMFCQLDEQPTTSSTIFCGFLKTNYHYSL